MVNTVGWTYAIGHYPQGLRRYCELVFSSNERAGGRHCRISRVQIMHGNKLAHEIEVQDQGLHIQKLITRLGIMNELTDELVF